MKRKVNLCSVLFAVLAIVFFCNSASGHSVCRGDVASLMGGPDAIVDVSDLSYIITYLHPVYGPNYVAPVGELHDADLADANGTGIVGGDGQIDIGDVAYLVCYLRQFPPFYSSGCAPNDFVATAAPEVIALIKGTSDFSESVDQDNVVKANSVSTLQVEPNDIIVLEWSENDASWGGGFSNFNLNISRGEYLNDFNSPVSWMLTNMTAEADGQGGINISGGCTTSLSDETQGGVFDLSFRVPPGDGPEYTINIQPTQGSWRRVLFDQLPAITLEVAAQGPQCINPPAYDLNNDCKIDFKDFALLSSEWLFCGLDVQEACWP